MSPCLPEMEILMRVNIVGSDEKQGLPQVTAHCPLLVLLSLFVIGSCILGGL